MAEMFQRIGRRGKVLLRVHMKDRKAAAAAMALPIASLTVAGHDPAVLWLGPNRWLIVSDVHRVDTLIDEIASQLSQCLYVATDVTASLCYYRLIREDAGRRLGAVCGFDIASLDAGQCVRTRLGKIPIIVAILAKSDIDLYVDVSQTSYFEALLRNESDLTEFRLGPSVSCLRLRPPKIVDYH